MITNIINKLFGTKIVNNKKISPSIKLRNDIQDDYWGFDENDHYKLLNKKGFLDKEFYIDGKKYNIVSSEQTSESFKLTVQNINNKDVFVIKILYGKKGDSDNQNIIYIDDFCRLSDHSEGVGTKMAVFIRDLAESRGFDIIGVHAVAQENSNKGYMNQSQLISFYNQHLNGVNVKLEYMNNSDCISYLEMEKRW